MNIEQNRSSDLNMTCEMNETKSASKNLCNEINIKSFDNE